MRCLVILFVPGLLHSSDALAQTADRALQVLGDAQPACIVGSPSATNLSNATFGTSPTSTSRIAISQFVDSNTATTLPATIDLTLPVACNASHRIDIRSDNGGLLRLGATSASAVTGGFRQFAAYRYRIDWSGQTLDQGSDAGLGSLASDQPAKGSLTVHLTTPAGAGPLIAGQYNDTLTIEVHAQD